MIVYNTTVKADAAIAVAWLHWLQHEQAPQMLATGLFSRFQVLQLLETDDSEGPTYAVQFYAASIADYEKYRLHFATHFQQQATERWGNTMVTFSTLMQVVA